MEEIKSNFIHDIIDADLAENPELKIHTRFPPEPNGYLHIGSAKAIWINVMTAKKYGGQTEKDAKTKHSFSRLFHFSKFLSKLFDDRSNAIIIEGIACRRISRGKPYNRDISGRHVSIRTNTLILLSTNALIRHRK